MKAKLKALNPMPTKRARIQRGKTVQNCMKLLNQDLPTQESVDQDLINIKLKIPTPRSKRNSNFTPGSNNLANVENFSIGVQESQKVTHFGNNLSQVSEATPVASDSRRSKSVAPTPKNAAPVA